MASNRASVRPGCGAIALRTFGVPVVGERVAEGVRQVPAHRDQHAYGRLRRSGEGREFRRVGGGDAGEEGRAEPGAGGEPGQEVQGQVRVVGGGAPDVVAAVLREAAYQGEETVEWRVARGGFLRDTRRSAGSHRPAGRPFGAGRAVSRFRTLLPERDVPSEAKGKWPEDGIRGRRGGREVA